MKTQTTAKELPACPVETTLSLIGNKWKVLILRDFFLAPNALEN
jgi:DNA-binding HxlR family transcriptional regulator